MQDAGEEGEEKPPPLTLSEDEDEGGEEEGELVLPCLDDELSEEEEEEEGVAAELGDEVPRLEWWKDITWHRILAITTRTTPFVPRKCESAQVDLKGRLARAIEEAKSSGDKERETCAWKALFTIDSLLFGEGSDKEGEANKGRTAQVSGRIALIEQGHWGGVSSEIDTSPKTIVEVTKNEAKVLAKRIDELMKAGELSRAAAAVWGEVRECR